MMFAEEYGERQALKDSFKIIKNDSQASICEISQQGDIEMPYTRIRKDGRYECVISFKGKKYSVYSKTKEELNKKITKKKKQLEKEYKNKKTNISEKEVYTLESWYNKWYKTDKLPFIREKTQSIIENCFKNHILPKLGKYKLEKLNKDIIQNFLNNIPKSRIKEQTTSYFKSCITQAYNEQIIEWNPFNNIKRDKKIKSTKKALTIEEQEKLLKYLKANDNRCYNVVLIYLCTGCRRNEINTLKKENIKNNFILINGTKTENSIRYLKITSELQELIVNNIETIQQLPTHYISKKLKSVFEKLNIDGSIHTFRHTFATNHYYLNTPVKQLQGWLGHSTVNLTLDIYTNVDPTIDVNEEKKKIKQLYNNLYYYTEKI